MLSAAAPSFAPPVRVRPTAAPCDDDAIRAMADLACPGDVLTYED